MREGGRERGREGGREREGERERKKQKRERGSKVFTSECQGRKGRQEEEQAERGAGIWERGKEGGGKGKGVKVGEKKRRNGRRQRPMYIHAKVN